MDTEILARLGDEYFDARNRADPFSATASGVVGYDGEVPDPSRDASARLSGRLSGLATELSGLAPDGFAGEERISHAILGRLLRDDHDTLQAGLEEVAVTASMVGAFAGAVSLVPTGSVASPEGAQLYLDRLSKLGGYFDAWAERHRQARADGRYPTAIGVRQTVAQVDGYLATPLDRDPLLQPTPGPDVDSGQWRSTAAELVSTVVRPALSRYRAALADELLPVGRSDDQVGVCHVPGGPDGYLALVRAHTTTDLTPADIHETGQRLIASLREEFAERGAQALGTSDVAEVLRRLRDDPALRFGTAQEIVDAVTSALRRAEAALPDRFHRYDIAPCVVREMDPAEAENSVLGYYMAPAEDGTRPGAHVVNTFRPDLRPRFEYEPLAFHESVPGHHLQIALAQTLTDLPAFRRFGYVTAHGEGWALYTERLADEMGLYSDELSRLGMVSFDAWRAGRLVVDTGMHYYGWSRDRAIEYLHENTALSPSNIANEVDRYIACPGQALAYMIGKLRILALRERATDIRDFHHEVLAHGPLPLDTLDTLIR
jgi:uncharacterized protein (DUF885 family)